MNIALPAGYHLVLPDLGPWGVALGFVGAYTASIVPFSLLSWWSRHNLKPKAPAADLLINCACLGFIAAYAPFKVAELVGVGYTSNWLMHHYIVGCEFLLIAHRWIGLIWGRHPAGAVRSISTYILYTSSAITELDYLPTGIPVTPPAGDLMLKAKKTLISGVCIMLSGSGIALFPEHHYFVTYCCAALFVSIMEALFVANSMLISVVFRYECLTNFNSPMTQASGLNDFWGRRWNMTVHRMLKTLYFDPVFEATGIRILAVCAAFGGSGAFHEIALHYIASAAADPVGKQQAARLFGWQTAFFMSSAVLGFAEKKAQKTFPKLAKQMSDLPWPTQTMLATMAILPTGFFFTAPLMEVGMIDSLLFHIPKVTR